MASGKTGVPRENFNGSICNGLFGLSLLRLNAQHLEIPSDNKSQFREQTRHGSLHVTSFDTPSLSGSET